MWSDKKRHHLTSLHESVWDIVEFGAQTPQVGNEDYDSDEAIQIRHFNSQVIGSEIHIHNDYITDIITHCSNNGVNKYYFIT
jgi:hypothetical protein